MRGGIFVGRLLGTSWGAPPTGGEGRRNGVRILVESLLDIDENNEEIAFEELTM